MQIHFGVVGKFTESCQFDNQNMIDFKKFQEKSLELNNSLINHGKKEWGFFPHHGSACSAAALNSYLVGPNGELYKCLSHFGDESKIIGSIFNEEIGLSELYVDFLSKSFEDDEECLQCKFLPICLGGCVDQRLQRKAGKGNSKICLPWKNNLKETFIQFYKWKEQGC